MLHKKKENYEIILQNILIPIRDILKAKSECKDKVTVTMIKRTLYHV